MPVCTAMPWGGSFHGHHGSHHGTHHHGPPPHGPHHHGPPPHDPHCHGPPPHPPHHGPHHGGPGGPWGRFGGCRGGAGGPRCRGSLGSCGRDRTGRGRWWPRGMGPRHWHCRPGAFDVPFDDALLVAMLMNFDLPVFSREDDTGEDVPPAAAAPSAPEEELEANIIRIDTRRFSPEDIRVSFSGGQLRVTAVHTDESGEEVTLKRSAALRPGAKVTAKLAPDGCLYIKAE